MKPKRLQSRIRIDLACTVTLDGYINGVYAPHQVFNAIVTPNPTYVHWTGTDLTAGWLATWSIVYDDNGNAYAAVTVQWVGAQ